MTDYGFLGKIKHPSLSEKKKAEKEAEELELRHENQKKTLYHNIWIGGAYIGAGLIAIAFCVRVLHLVLPYDCRWLCNNDLEEINQFLFSGTLGAVVGKYVKPATKD